MALTVLVITVVAEADVPPFPAVNSPVATAAKFSCVSLKLIWKFSLSVAAVSVLGAILSQIDKVIISILLPSSLIKVYVPT